MFVEVLTFPFARTQCNVGPCRRACRSVNDNLAVLCSAISYLVQSVLRALCVILSSCWSNNVGGSTSISFDVREQELELMVEHIQFFIVGSLPCFRLSHLSVTSHKVVRIAFHFFISSFAETNDSTFRLFFRYLASRMNFGDLEFDFKVSRKTIPVIVQETCEVIWNVSHPLEMPELNKEMWLKKSAEFYKFTSFPNCVGSVDGKHIRMQCPSITGSISTSRNISQLF